MAKIILSFVIGGVVGAADGFAVAIFVYPFIFLADVVAMEQAPDAASRQIVAEGSFIHANPKDPLHYGRGAVTVFEDTVHLGSDFEVGPGPKFHVYLVPLDEIKPDTEVGATMFIDLGRLRAFKGSQNFVLPAGIDLANYGSVVIWCEQFDVLISPAKLNFQGKV